MNQRSIHDRIMSREGGLDIPELREGEKAKKSLKKITAFSALGLLLVAGIVGFAAYQFPQVRQAFAAPATAQKAPGPALPDTPFLAHTKQAGISTCASVYPILGQLLTNGARYDVVSQWNRTDPDHHPIQAIVGLEYASQAFSGEAGGFVTAIPNGKDCDGLMVRVTPLQTPCANVPGTLPQGSKAANTLGKTSLYTLADNGGQILLVPSGETCVAVSIATARG